MQLQNLSTNRSAAFRRSALSLGEELFDRIEVRGIGRQGEEPLPAASMVLRTGASKTC